MVCVLLIKHFLCKLQFHSYQKLVGATSVGTHLATGRKERQEQAVGSQNKANVVTCIHFSENHIDGRLVED